MVCIIDYGVGNLASIKNMLKKIGVPALISAIPEEINGASKIILPGVGAFDTCAQKLADSGLRPVLETEIIEKKKPVLGICVGMQLLFEGSEEGKLPGLGWVGGTNIRFRADKMNPALKIPHMGWTDVEAVKDSPLLKGLEASRFYFVHSFHAQLQDPGDALLSADYGYSFIAAVEKKNILGTQFHPEKSHKYGMQLLGNFVNNY